MSKHRLCTWTIRLAALIAVAAVIPACSLLGGGVNGSLRWGTTSSGPVAPGAPNTTNIPLWTNPNLAIPGPIGINGIGGIEVTYGDADPTTYPPSNPEASHPISTSRSLDPTGEATINGSVQQLYVPQVPVNGNGGGQVANAGPYLQTGDTKLAGISRARAKHETLHPMPNGALGAPDPGGVAQRCTWMKVNPAFTNARQFEISGQAMTATQAATNITGQIGGAAGLMLGSGNAFGAAGYWTSGAYNYYCFTMINLPTNAGGP